MFKRWKKDVQGKANREIALAKLEFLAEQYRLGIDKEVDALFWKEQFDVLEQHHNGTSELRHAIHAYRLIYELYLEKNNISFLHSTT